jgi:hypothetical protein
MISQNNRFRFVAGVLPEPLIYRPSVNPVRPCSAMGFDPFQGDPQPFAIHNQR